MMNRVLLGGLALAVICSAPALAGKNDGGSLIVHTNDTYTWSNQGVCAPAEGVLPTDCASANTTATLAEDQVIWVLAAFHPDATPGVTVVYFGIEYDDVNLDPGVNLRMCGPAGSIEVPDDDWPYTGRGNSVAFGAPVLDHLFPVYAFRINGGTTGSFFGTANNPTGGYASFVDDGNPPGSDFITKFGTVKWNEPGSATCPEPARQGACCVTVDRAGFCIQLLSESDCVSQQGVWLGTGVDCGVTPCGACCYWKDEGGGAVSRQCIVTSPDNCTTDTRWAETRDVDGRIVGPDWSYDGTACALSASQQDTLWWCADPREGTATKETSWGTVKSLFR